MKLITAHFDYKNLDVSWFLSLMLLCITLGPSIKSIAVVLAVLVVLGTPHYRKHVLLVCKQPFFIAILALLAVTVLGCTWSPANWHDKLAVVEKYAKLLYLPVLALGFIAPKTRHRGIQAYIAGMFVVCCISFYKFYFKTNSEPDSVFYNHIVTSYMMAFAAYLAAWSSIHAQSMQQKLRYGLVLLMFSIQIFGLNSGRTGQMIYILLFALLLVQHFSLKQLRYPMLFFVLSLTIVLHQLHSHRFMTGIQAIQQNIHSFQAGEKNTSIGFRLQFHQYAKSLFLSKPLLGHGTGSFIPQFIQDNPIPAWQDRPDPHSQYWHTASELGLLGIAMLVLFFGIMLKMSWALPTMKPILQAVILPFCVACFSDTLLLTSGIGYLLITFSALCLGEFVEQRSIQKNSATTFPLNTIGYTAV
jgi:O-antigen ligase